MSKKPATVLTHAGADPARHCGALNVPPYRMSTVVIDNYEDFVNIPHGLAAYGRIGTPSTTAFEKAVAALEGAHGSVVTCSGLNAVVTAQMAFAQAGDHVLKPDNCYGPGRRSANEVMRRYGVETEFYPPLTKDVSALFRKNTRVVFVEAPGSLTYEVPDVGAIIAAARTAGITTVMDNSWATPLNLRGFDFGADIVLMSATKYISGHADAMLGVISARDEASYAAIRKQAIYSGVCPGSEEVYLGLRGLRTLHVRMAQHAKSALDIAQWLSAHKAVKRVLHPALPSCPGHENWKKYFTGASGTFGIVLHETSREKLAAAVNAMTLFRIGFSWGGYESLLLPEQPGHARTAEPWTETGLCMRLHIGLEDVEDIRADLEKGLSVL